MGAVVATYWPFWAGGLALAAVTVLYWGATGRPLGVSGAWARVVQWRRERDTERAEAAMGDDDAALMAALEAATLEEFGEGLGPDELAELRALEAEDEADPEARAAVHEFAAARRIPVSGHAVFLGGLVLGGLLGALLSGGLHPTVSLGPTFAGLFGDGPAALLPLLAGGLLVGLGTRMAGGCTSGHGLSGCACLRPGSYVATASFFGAAVVASLLLGAVLT